MKFDNKTHYLYWSDAHTSSHRWSYYALHTGNAILTKNDKNLKFEENRMVEVQQSFIDQNEPEKAVQWKEMIYNAHSKCKKQVEEETKRLKSLKDNMFEELNTFRKSIDLKPLISLGFSSAHDFIRTDLL